MELIGAYLRAISSGALGDGQQKQAMPEVHVAQQTWVRYSTEQRGRPTVAGWIRNLDLCGVKQSQTAQDDGANAHMSDQVTARIDQAPMEWCLPVRQGVRLKPPFRLAVTVQGTHDCHMPVTVTPACLTEEEYSRVDTWAPREGISLGVSSALGSQRVSVAKAHPLDRMFKCEGSANGHCVKHAFEFKDLELSLSEGSQKVYFIFDVRFSTAANIYVVLLIPTVCVGAGASGDEYDRGLAMLRKDLTLTVSALQSMAICHPWRPASGVPAISVPRPATMEAASPGCSPAQAAAVPAAAQATPASSMPLCSPARESDTDLLPLTEYVRQRSGSEPKKRSAEDVAASDLARERAPDLCEPHSQVPRRTSLPTLADHSHEVAPALPPAEGHVLLASCVAEIVCQLQVIQVFSNLHLLVGKHDFVRMLLAEHAAGSFVLVPTAFGFDVGIHSRDGAIRFHELPVQRIITEGLDALLQVDVPEATLLVSTGKPTPVHDVCSMLRDVHLQPTASMQQLLLSHSSRIALPSLQLPGPRTLPAQNLQHPIANVPQTVFQRSRDTLPTACRPAFRSAGGQGSGAGLYRSSPEGQIDGAAAPQSAGGGRNWHGPPPKPSAGAYPADERRAVATRGWIAALLERRDGWRSPAPNDAGPNALLPADILALLKDLETAPASALVSDEALHGQGFDAGHAEDAQLQLTIGQCVAAVQEMLNRADARGGSRA